MGDLARTPKRRLVFDVDGSQYTDSGAPCTICGARQVIWEGGPRSFVRIREKIPLGTRIVAYVCPECVGRLFLQTERLRLWNQVSGTVRAAIRRVLMRRWANNADGPAALESGEGE